MEVVFETLDRYPDVTSVQMFCLKLSPHVGQLIIRLLVVKENIEESLPKLFFGVGITLPIQLYQCDIVSVLHQDEGGIGKSIPDGRKISRDPSRGRFGVDGIPLGIGTKF